MKQCPACKTTYTDQTLRFCLSDGNPLTDLSREQETVIQGSSFHDAETVAIGGGPAWVEIPRETVQIVSPSVQTAVPATSGSSGGIFKVLMVIIGLGIFAVIAIAAVAFIYLNMTGQERDGNNKDIKTAAQPTPTPTKDDEAELRDQIANLEKLIARTEPAPSERSKFETTGKRVVVSSPSRAATEAAPASC